MRVWDDVHRAVPERRLMAAVLWGAVEDCRPSGSENAESRRTQQARAWVASRNRTWPFSFENLCESLGVDARQVRRRLR